MLTSSHCASDALSHRAATLKKLSLHSRPVRALDADDTPTATAPTTTGHLSVTSTLSPGSSIRGSHTASEADSDDFDAVEDDCKYDDDELLKTHTPLLTGTDVESKREEIRDYFHRTFTLYEKLFSVLASDGTYFMQPEKLRHPLIFYFGHTAVFFVNKLRLAGVLKQRINESLESTLAIGVDEMSWDDLNTGNYVWPSVDQVRKYRDLCRVVVDDLISSLPLTLPITWESPFWVILMGCEHERIHLETSSVLFRQLPIEQVRAVPMWDHCREFRARPEDVPRNAFLSVPGGHVTAGKNEQTQDAYGWDLEYGTFNADVAPFVASKYLCSNAEFLEFVRAGGYQDESLWGEEGWRFVQFRKATCPVFWVPQEEENADGALRHEVTYGYRTMTAVIEMPMDWPVDCNYIEAKAFCTWKNRQREASGEAARDGKIIRMPTEAEYFRLRDHAFPETITDPKTGRVLRQDQPYWGTNGATEDEEAGVAPGNINLEHGASSCPIDKFEFEHGFFDVIGNVWQWTETPIMPFRGFRFHPMYDDFSVPTFDTRHNIFTGGSWASTGNEALRSARYAFRRHFYQHAGFRYILADPLPEIAPTAQAMCETDPTVTFMMDAQYNDFGLAKVTRSLGMNLTNYSVRIADLAIEAYRKYHRTVHASTSPNSDTATTFNSAGPRAIDIGCACGRTTFELAKLAAPSDPSSSSLLFDHILGLDFSTRFIRIAAQLQFDAHAEYATKKEGDLISYHSIENAPGQPSDEGVSRLDLDLKSRGMLERVEFMQGDACNLSSKYSGFSLVLASNLLEYLYSPRLFLRDIGKRVRPGGILVLASTYGWDEAYTPRSHWLGGLKDATGESVDSLRTIGELLADEFDPITDATQDVPMVWKQNHRQYQLRFAQCTVWRRRG